MSGLDSNKRHNATRRRSPPESNVHLHPKLEDSMHPQQFQADYSGCASQAWIIASNFSCSFAMHQSLHLLCIFSKNFVKRAKASMLHVNHLQRFHEHLYLDQVAVLF
jgi:hypothetical protein